MQNLLLQKVKETGKHTFIFGIAQFLQSGIAIILLPVYTRYLSATELGIASLINISIGIVVPILLLGFNVSLFRYYYFENDLEKERLITTSFIFIGFVTLLCIACLTPFVSYFAVLFFNDANYSFLMLLVVVSLFPRAIQQLYFSLFRASKSSFKFSLVNMVGFLVTLGLSIYLIVFLELRLKGLIYAGLGGITVMFVLSPFLSGFIPKRSFDFNKLKKLVSWGLPFVPGSIIALILSNSDRYIISMYHPLSEVGTYDIVYKISSIVHICFFAPFALIATPITFDVYKQLEEPAKFYSAMLTYVILVGGFIAFLLSIMGSVILKIFTAPDYYSAYGIIPIIAFSYVFTGSMRMISPGILLKDKTFFLPLIDGAGCVVNIILNLLFVPKFGIYAAATTTILTSILLFCARAYISRIYYPIAYEYKRMSGIFALYLIMLLVHFCFRQETLLLNIGLNAVIAASTMAVIYFVLLKDFEKEWIQGFFNMNFFTRTITRS